MVDALQNQYSRKVKQFVLINAKLYTHWTKHNFSRDNLDKLNLLLFIN